MNEVHFAKFLDRPIWNCITEREVILKGVRKDTVLFLNGKPQEQEQSIMDFRVIVDSDEEVISNDLPESCTVIRVEKTTVRKPAEVTPENFLKRVKNIVYDINSVTDEEMKSKSHVRKRELVLARQVVMATYFCVFENYKRRKVSQREAGEIYHKDHATVIHAVDTVNDLLETDKFFREDYSKVWEICKKINPKSKLKI